VLVFACGLGSSGIPADWAAQPDRLGVNLLDDLSPAQVTRIAGIVDAARRPGDLVIASVHWGPNWGYEVPSSQTRFAHGLIDGAGIDIVHGHSSHHAKAIEVYHGRPIIYGCGDLLNDYEGISGHEKYRGDLPLMYFPSFDAATLELVEFRMSPMQLRRLRLSHSRSVDAVWMANRLTQEGERFGTRVAWDGRQLELKWT
ncbi:MAG: CapA family protein, partial [Gammaproteobacteria bacterium]